MEETVKNFFRTAHYAMADTSPKHATLRRAIAQGRLHVGEVALKHLQAGTLPKGDALKMAEIVGITGAKRAHDFLPLCHPLPLDHVQVMTELEPHTHSVAAYCTVTTTAKTGVEMEAVAGVNAALLALYDLCKPIEPALVISDVRLLLKEGGKSGRWVHPLGLPPRLQPLLAAEPQRPLDGVTAAALTVSDRASRGEYADESGEILKTLLAEYGAKVTAHKIVPDDAAQITHTARALIEANAPDVVILTGGTGLSPRDVTPDALATLCDRPVPGIGELLRQDGARYTRHAWLSRAFAGLAGHTLLIALPGNPNAVKEGMAALKDLLPHAIRHLRGVPHG